MIPRATLLALTRRASSDREPGMAWPWPADGDYWLARCDGFVVSGPDGAIGVVDHVVYGSRVDRPEVMAVRRAWRHGLLMVPVTDVVEINPSEGWLVVEGGRVVRAARVGVVRGLRRLAHPHSRAGAAQPFGGGR